MEIGKMNLKYVNLHFLYCFIKFNKFLLQSFHKKLSKLEKIEMEVIRLKRGKIACDFIQKKLADELVYLKRCIDEYVQTEPDNIDTKVRIESLVAALEEYKLVTADYCPADTIHTAELLRVYIDDILEKNLNLINELMAVQTHNTDLEICLKYANIKRQLHMPKNIPDVGK